MNMEMLVARHHHSQCKKNFFSTFWNNLNKKFSVEKPALGPAPPAKQPDYSHGESTPAPEPAAPAPLQEETEEPEPSAAHSQVNTLEEHKAREDGESVEAHSNANQSLKPGYNAEPVSNKLQPTGNENLPMLGKSPPMTVNYQTGEVLVKGKGGPKSTKQQIYFKNFSTRHFDPSYWNRKRQNR